MGRKRAVRVDDPSTPDVDESKVVGHDINDFTDNNNLRLHKIAKLANSAIPMNRQVNITQVLIDILVTAYEAYEVHTGQPYDPDNLPDIPEIPV